MWFADVRMELNQGCLLKWNFQRAADRLQNSLPRKRKASYRPARALITHMQARFPKKMKWELREWAWKISLQKDSNSPDTREKETFFEIKICSQILAYLILIITMNVGCGYGPWKNMILHFVAGRRERECQWFASQGTWVTNDWSRTQVFWSLLDGVLSASFCLYKWEVGHLSSNLFTFRQKCTFKKK